MSCVLCVLLCGCCVVVVCCVLCVYVCCVLRVVVRGCLWLYGYV